MQSLGGTIITWINSLRHNCFGIDFRLLFLGSGVKTTGMNMSVKMQRIAN